MTTRVVKAKNKEEQQDLNLIFTLSDIQKLVTRMMIRETIKENLTLKQSAVLQILANKGPVPMNQISQELLTTAANITSLIDRLEKRGLVQRTEDKADRRKIVIQLTTDGKKMFEVAAERYRKNIQESFEILTPKEKDELIRLLGKVRDEISRIDVREKQS